MGSINIRGLHVNINLMTPSYKMSRTFPSYLRIPLGPQSCVYFGNNISQWLWSSNVGSGH